MLSLHLLQMTSVSCVFSLLGLLIIEICLATPVNETVSPVQYLAGTISAWIIGGTIVAVLVAALIVYLNCASKEEKEELDE